ncbi:mannose-6-phosphate isomerase, class I [Luteipulveratus halotolerans]|uniref:mannose-6-phosphate isomerase n=1 Tax=Luteipulveratus halotolerans TaxID=1631356 RepID=A0A0L6CKB1_9MICO|nr:mannose-6-phosphate isomerase, class I [Luteipulveratus halotolerans]KNX38217.1 hypothetical protein VV01_15400 [Luteipulveratus halotolerans]
MHRLTPVVQHYAWGSYDGLARVSGRPHPTAEPEAELWMGAHEGAPAGLTVDGASTTLDQVIAADPVGWLGASVAARFGARLPFLLKVLAPAKALSIQAHPDADEATSAPEGTYVDGWPKPESWLAIEPTEAFIGARPFGEFRSLAIDLGVERLVDLVESAAVAESPSHELLRLLLSANDARALVDEVLTACADRADDPTVEAVLRVARDFPGDIGLVVLLTMRRLALQPGDYVFLAAGVMHSLVSGLLVEVLANSDNVVRAGLTPKKIDVPELLRIVDVERAMVPEPGDDVDGWTTYDAETPYFRLRTRVLDDGAVAVPATDQPRILLCLNGSADVDGLALTSGESCFLAPGDEATITGDGTLYLASPGLP